MCASGALLRACKQKLYFYFLLCWVANAHCAHTECNQVNQ